MSTAAAIDTRGTAGLRPSRPVDLRRAIRLGPLAGVVAIVMAAIGMVETFESRVLIDPFLALGYAALYLVPFAFGYVAAQPPEQLEGFAPPKLGGRNVAAGALAGLLCGVLLTGFSLLAGAVDLRTTFPSVSPAMVQLLRFGLGAGAAAVVVPLVSTVVGASGGVVHLLPARLRRSILYSLAWVLLWGLLEDVFQQFFRGFRVPGLNQMLYARSGGLSVRGAVVIGIVFFGIYWYLGGRKTTVRGRFEQLNQQQRVRVSLVAVVLVFLALAVLPSILGSFLSEVLDLAGLFLLMALGLNIVVGFAGLLDLGYVAFFAVGAYTAAILTSPNSPRWTPEMTLWGALPFVMLAAAVAGLLVGAPVLRMRGDYLAIVTLGFGEIARILLNSEALAPEFGGAQGIINIPTMTIGPIIIKTPQNFFFPIFIFVLLAVYVSLSLQKSRIGRAWMAMREDESVAETMGVNIVTAKLSAFIVGAVLASLGGALFSAKIGAIFPHSFNIVVSITVLVIIIVGGMGSIPGVALGAVVLIAMPELLREFSEYKFLLYGVLLIFMMIKRPEGFIPSRRRAKELHKDELLQDAWMDIYQADAGDEPAEGDV
ncbi:MAG: hypothetical protein GXP34_01650 [Actinobacteria bacterium]|nr:hypothetical protein [Actinomycetota bacterium]